jgi:uncharacterized protein YjdB
VVTEPVPAGVDPSTVQLTGFGFGSTVVVVPPGHQSFGVRLDQRSTIGDFVDVEGFYDPAAQMITWSMSTINPATGDLDTSPTAGFLPPDDTAGNGEGYVAWTAAALPSLPTGTALVTSASIVFDRNPAIGTGTWTNTIDADAPDANIVGLPTSALPGPLNITWAGNDHGASGVASFDVYVSIDGGPLALWLPGRTTTSANYSISAGHTYGFAVRATDNVGNVGAAPTSAQATVTAQSTIVPIVPTTTTLSATPNPATAGSAVTLTATISPAGGSGTVTFMDGPTALGTSTLSGATASLITVALTPGTHQLTASFAGDATHAASVSTPIDLLVKPAPVVISAISVSPASTSVAAGLTAAFTATATRSDGTTQVLTSGVEWSSSDPATATIRPDSGVATAIVAGGPVTITARITVDGRSLSDTARLTVTAAERTPEYIALVPGRIL